MAELVTIATFSTPDEANIVRLALGEEGILSFLEGEATVGNFWHLGVALGGVKLQVPEGDAVRAGEIIFRARNKKHQPANAAVPATCPKCGSAIEPEFDVCWSCGADIENPGDATERVADETEIGDARARRAWRVAALGVFFCQPLVSLYSVWLLMQLGADECPLSPHGKRHCRWASVINSLVIGVVLLYVWMILVRQRF